MAFMMFQCVLIAAAAVMISSDSSNIPMERMKILDDILNVSKYDTRVRPLPSGNILDGILNVSKYDTRVRPPPSGISTAGPVTVRINTYIRSISEIDDAKMEYSAQITLRMAWIDPRLKYDDKGGKIKYLTLADTSRVWKPDLFFSNEKSGHFHNILMPNELMRIHPDGSVLYSTKISLKLSCPMDLHHYPMDRQTCSILMASYAYTTEDVNILWKETYPVQISKNLPLSQFTMKTFLTNYCTSRTATGEYSCVKIDFVFARKFAYYLLQIYIPSIALVILSWVSFWFSQKATTARLFIWATTLFTLVIKVSTISAKFPTVSYTTSIDVWTGVCFTFLYAVVFELAIVAHAVNTEGRQQRSGNEDVADESSVKKLMTSHDSDGRAERKSGLCSRFSMLNRLLQRYPTRSQRIDLFARILFPVAFAFFNIIYWATCLRIDGD